MSPQYVRDDIGIAFDFIQKDWKFFKNYTSNPKISERSDIVIAAVKQNWETLKYIKSKDLDNKEIVLHAVKQNGLALQYAGANMKKDLTVVKAAVEQNLGALYYASKELKKNEELLRIAYNKNPLIIRNFPSEEL